MPDRRDLKEDNEVRRQFFAANLSDLISKVLGLNRLEGAKALGVDYGWLRKACSVGLTKADNRSLTPLRKVAERFHLSVEDLWTPALLVQIWAKGHLPEVRSYFIKEFSFDKFVESSKAFREAVEDLEDYRGKEPQADLAEGDRPQGEDDEANRRAREELTALLATGKYESLRHLIHDLFVAEAAKG
jgi:hypothetical protein